jgi:AraC family transcriptional regulator
VQLPFFQALVVNPPRDGADGQNFVMGGPRGPNFQHRGRDPYSVTGLVGWLSVKTVRRGRGTWVTPDGRHHLDEGYAVVLNEGQAYGFELAIDEPVETFCAFLKPGVVEDAQRVMGLNHATLLDAPSAAAQVRLEFPERTHPTDPHVQCALAPLYDAATAGEIEPLAWDDGFAALATALLRARGSLAPGLAPGAIRASTRAELSRRLARAVDYIHGNAAEHLDLEKIAAAAALSPHHFHRLFRRAFRRTPHAYLTQLRLARAARLLARTGQPVTEVCLTVGFSSLGSFSTAFRRAFGLSPSQWRAKAQDSRSEMRLEV